MTKSYKSRLDFAKEIARDAGALALSLFEQRETGFVASKGLQDFVTLADRKVETLIRSQIAAHFPDDAVLGEEDGLSGNSERVWVVDPIDGTANYMRGLPDWAISIACCEGNDIAFGVIFVPARNELCWAEKGHGCFCNDEQVTVSDCQRADEALLLLGRSGRCSLQSYLDLVTRTIDAGMEYRRNGSAAVSLMDVAQGRAEGFFEAHLNAWDAMAGILLVQEAGGVVRADPVTQTLSHGTEVIATARNTHADIVATIDA
ncbi:inositol monophosphatase family protein [Shimia sp. MMG029]|uniref:inositol monophosphatase family protein n=1 Tax=Shimia sp. MMG029 TaxID=3021978 RepID=UPI0022FE8C81|nr:inositol monophosphatase [Shimia sp. MMG029]MDA5555818.1 inositol monophosphatase [Shimia sp. MMG029]